MIVLDMSQPRKPAKVATLVSAGDAQPARVPGGATRSAGCWARCSGNPFTNIGILELYDVRTELPRSRSCCRRPTPRCSATRAASRPTATPSTRPAPAGRRFAAIDVKDPAHPKRIFDQYRRELPRAAALGRRPDDVRRQHRQRLSGVGISSGGLRILDVSPDPGPRSPTRRSRWSPNLDLARGVAAAGRPSRSPGRAATTCSRSTSSRTSASTADQPGRRRRSGAARIIDVEDPHAPARWSPTCGWPSTSPERAQGDQHADPGAAHRRCRATPATTARCPRRRTPRSSAAR